MGSFAAFAIVAAGVLATAASDAARTHPNPAITSAASARRSVESAPTYSTRGSFVFDAAFSDRERRQDERNLCSFDKACGLTAGPDGEEVNQICCKTCQIQGINYKIDVNTFIDTMSRGSRKNPMMEYEYCGLEQFRSWPREKDDTVGVLNAPFTEDKADALPFREPDTDYYTRTDLPLQRYDERGAAEVLFVKHSYKMMHASSYRALKSLATRWNNVAGASGFKLLVTQGYEPLPADRPQGDLHKDLYYEARELHMTIVYAEFNQNGQLKSQCGSKCLIGREDERDNITSPFHEYAVRLKTKDEVPACLMDGASRADWVMCCFGFVFFTNQEYNYRLLADMAFTQFDYVEHKVLPGTESTQPIDAVVVAMRDHHRACSASADITFLLDGSGSVGDDGWRDQLKFVRDFTGAVRPSEDGARIAVATFAGPRFSHFADDIDYEHCPLGTSNIGDMRGWQSTNNVCACAEGASCSGPNGTTANETGCYDDIVLQYLSAYECSDALAEAGIFGFNSYEYSKKKSIYPECIAKRANVYTPDCSSCSCSEPDYTWDESHSSWTNFDFKDHATAEEIFKTLDEGTPTDNNLVCPVIGHGKVHTEIRYQEFHAKDDFCWADGARHLAMGLKHVLIGNGEQNDNGGGGDFGMFDPRNGARASQKFPRILIVLTDGKSNPHFEPDQWMTEIFKAGIEVFAVGMGDRPANDFSEFERRGYKKELNVMASEPLDYHRFDVQGASNLTEILLHLTDGLCEKPVFMPPGGLKLDPQLDEGQSENYQISCDHMTENIFVMVDTPKGHSRVFVSADVREPSEFNKGADGVEDISANRHKIIKFEGGASLAEKKNIYVGVTNIDAATAEFRIQVFLDVFQDNGMVMKGVMVDKKKAGDVIYAPKFKTGNSVYGSLIDWEISVANSGSSTLNNKGFFEYKSGKGIVVTAKGANEFASVSYVVGTLELTAAHKKLGTANWVCDIIAAGNCNAAKTRAACRKLCDDNKGGAVQCTHYKFDGVSRTCVLSDPGSLNAFFSIDFTHDVNGGDACLDNVDDEPVKLGLTWVKCSEASAGGYCQESRTAAEEAGNSKAEGMDDEDWAAQVFTVFQARCPVACEAPCAISTTGIATTTTRTSKTITTTTNTSTTSTTTTSASASDNLPPSPPGLPSPTPPTPPYPPDSNDNGAGGNGTPGNDDGGNNKNSNDDNSNGDTARVDAVDDDWMRSWLDSEGLFQNGDDSVDDSASEGQKVSTGIIIAVALGAAIFLGILVAVVVQKLSSNRLNIAYAVNDAEEGGGVSRTLRAVGNHYNNPAFVGNRPYNPTAPLTEAPRMPPIPTHNAATLAGGPNARQHAPMGSAGGGSETLYATATDANYMPFLDNFAGGNKKEMYDQLARFGQVPNSGSLYDSVVAAGDNDLYNSAALYQSATVDKLLYEHAALSELSEGQKWVRHEKAARAMAEHQDAYDALFTVWESQSWIDDLQRQHKIVVRYIQAGEVKQPNPWANSVGAVTSKRYMLKLLETYSKTDPSAPVPTVERACVAIVSELGTAVVTFKLGPIKKQSRVFEKVLSSDGHFDLIRDYARGTFVVKRVDVLPRLLAELLLADDFTVIRAKNRLSNSWDSRDSAGYRDYQLLVQTKEGWIVELQLIPEGMHVLKEKLGHADYVQYRFIVEAGHRVRGGSGGDTGRKVTCAYKSAANGSCYGPTGSSDRLFCPSHSCPAPGCGVSKSSRAQYCSKHQAQPPLQGQLLQGTAVGKGIAVASGAGELRPRAATQRVQPTPEGARNRSATLQTPPSAAVSTVGKRAVATSAGSGNRGNTGKGKGAGGIKKDARKGSVYAGFEEPGGGGGMQKDTRKGSVYTGFDGVAEVEEEV